MLDTGMYSILLKWGLDTLKDTITSKDPRHLQILLEAVKLRNSIVLKRFDFAWIGANAVLDLTAEVEAEMDKFKDSGSTTRIRSSATRTKDILATLRNEVHPKFHRRLKRIRGNFEATNDLFSAYSIEFWNMLRFDSLSKVLNLFNKPSDVLRTYRHAWRLYCDIMLTLIRVSSYDLRFWLSDVSYFHAASKMASADRQEIERRMCSGDDGIWLLALENPKKVSEFWGWIDHTDHGRR